jgi:Zn-finger nucleic acid-binding protein
MKCPLCEVVELTVAERSGVEIDYCTSCRGVWLDRGELDKIIERASLALADRPRDSDRDDRRRERAGHDYDDDREGGGRSRERRGGLLGDHFDF